MNQENYYASLRAIASAPVSTNDQRPAVGASNGRWDAVPAWRYRRGRERAPGDLMLTCALAPLIPLMMFGAFLGALDRRR
jgi:hypothetical protein